MADVIVILILLAVVAAAVCYIVRAKKKGQKCIGCPYASQCGGKRECGQKEEDDGRLC